MLRDATLAELSRLLQAEVDQNLKITSAEAVSGGCINQAVHCKTDSGQEYFVKLNSATKARMFAAEALGLQALQASNTVLIPGVIATGKAGSQAFLILEYLPLQGVRDDFIFGQQLARMHQHTADQYGFESDNFIGATPQLNSWHDNWYEFFMTRRLQFQLDLLPVNGPNQALRDQWPDLIQACDKLFSSHAPKAALLHGDLWQGNVAQVGDEICLFDPATYYGDPEADLAMLELFGSPGQNFYRGYESISKVSAEYPKRRTFYNLYHVLNHSNLFGNSYSMQALGMVKQIIGWGS